MPANWRIDLPGEGENWRARAQRALRRGAPQVVSAEDLDALAAALPPFEDWSCAAERQVRLETNRALPALRAFVERGGTLIALGDQAESLARHLELPLEIGVWVRDEDGTERRARNDEFYVPTSLLRASVDAGHDLGLGVPAELAVVFRRSPVFRVTDPGAAIDVVARFGRGDVLRSGWAIGEELLEDRAAVLSVPIGRGSVHLFGADVVFRGQPEASLKMLYNAVFSATARRE